MNDKPSSGRRKRHPGRFIVTATVRIAVDAENSFYSQRVARDDLEALGLEVVDVDSEVFER